VFLKEKSMARIAGEAEKLVARAGIRAGDEDAARIGSDGWEGWVQAQLKMPADDNTDVREALSKATLKIAYEAEEGFAALTEDRPLSSLRKPTSELWHLTDWEVKMAWEERIRPGRELIAATHLRAVLSDAQLRETVADFWRDHFTVNRDAKEDVEIALPTYDQKVLRKHAFGNFREMLEAVATSTAMLAYLNNASSRASPANENYARELFELHGLGSQAYFNSMFDRWREVPGATEGKAKGYIDEDVYEAARAFTGWSYESGQYVTDGVTLPRTGAFTYIEHWHDPYQKRVLGVEFDSHLGPMVDGRNVLDLVAFHPATARHVVLRLCKRFVADAPPDDLVKSATQLFVDTRKAPDQLAQVIQHILVSPAFHEAQPRLQRPLFLFASLQRRAGVVLPPDQENGWLLDLMGHRLYNWQSPAGHPMVSSYWNAPGLLVRRWRAMQTLWTKIMAAEPDQDWASADVFADEWSSQLGLDATHAAATAQLLKTEFGDENHKPSFAEADRWTVAQALTFLSSTPEFQAV
jgi:uncharacterized protein (DUF1800 family)